ncbi:MAG: signal peptidase I [Acidobacteriia bacterium]|nr:signal peptidase I [Terriglobia bacterium]
MFKKTDKEKPPKHEETLPESIAGIASVLVSGLFIITFVVQAFEIPSRSMEDTLLVGDHVFVDRLTPAAKAGYVGPLVPYREVHRGDIVVFISPAEHGLYVVKRIIGVPGDRIRLRNRVVYVNGVANPEPYVKYLQNNHVDYRDEFPSVPPDEGSGVASYWPAILKDNINKDGELVVPPHSYFGMGDDREISLDSRYWGFIPQENVIGRPLFIYWSFETPEGQYQLTDLKDRIQFVGHVILHFFDKTQWRRMFHLVR